MDSIGFGRELCIWSQVAATPQIALDFVDFVAIGLDLVGFAWILLDSLEFGIELCIWSQVAATPQIPLDLVGI